jgi:hypothetical protein
MLSKQAWWLIQNLESLARTLRARYFLDGDILFFFKSVHCTYYNKKEAEFDTTADTTMDSTISTHSRP